MKITFHRIDLKASGIPNDFSLKPICSIKTPFGQKDICLEDIESRYTRDNPDWDKDFQSFSEGPIFYDKLFKKSPFKRALDIEKEKEILREKIIIPSNPPFDMTKDSEQEIIKKTKDVIMKNLQGVIEALNLANKRLKVNESLPKAIENIIKGKKLKELNEKQIIVDTIQNIQMEAFDMLLQNVNDFKLYEMR